MAATFKLFKTLLFLKKDMAERQDSRLIIEIF
jgi:hypothetical protein